MLCNPLVVEFQDLLFCLPKVQLLRGLQITAHITEVVFKFLEFEQVEDFLSFQHPVLLEEKLGKLAIGISNSLSVGLLKVFRQWAKVIPNTFPDIHRLLVEDNG